MAAALGGPGVIARRGALLGRHATTATGQLVDVDPALRETLPEAGLRRGSVVGVGGSSGATTVLLALLAGPLRAGSWAGVVGMDGLGLEAAVELGVPLERLALVPRPGDTWPEVAGSLLGAMDIVVLRPPSHCRPGVARRLAARCRDRRALLLVAGSDLRRWPEPLDLHLEVQTLSWAGLERGAGTLARRLVEVRTGGRRSAGRDRRTQIWFPTVDGC